MDEERKKRLEKAKKLLEIWADQFFYGKVTFSLENGQVVNVKEEKTYKL